MVPAVGVGMGYVALPIARAVAEGRSEIGVPEIVRAGAPGVIVWPLRMRSELGPRVNVKPSMVRRSDDRVAAAGVGIGNVALPIATAVPEGRSEIGVPEIVRAGAPEPGPLEKVKPSNVRRPGDDGAVVSGEGIGTVESPKTTAFPVASSEIGVPDTVTAWPPGVSVWVPMIRLESGPCEKEIPFAVNTFGASVTVGGRPGTGITDPPTTTAVPEGDKEIGVPDMVIALAPGVTVWVPRTRAAPEPREKEIPFTAKVVGAESGAAVGVLAMAEVG
ncbi:MAG: hypothetical protein Q9203_005477 [Teloschistes exilis]